MDSTTPRSRADKMTIDAASGNLFWSISRSSKTAGTTRMRTRSVVPLKSPSPAPSLPPKPTQQQKSLRPVRRSPVLQAHFFHMQRTLNTCHPGEIRAEALKLIQKLNATSSDKTLETVHDIAIRVFGGGWRSLEYSRSFALLAHEISSELRFTSWAMMKAFQEDLLNLVDIKFKKCSLKVRFRSPHPRPWPIFSSTVRGRGRETVDPSH